jgi:hypothetical protein
MPVPNAVAPDETSMVTSWDAFKLPVDIEDIEDDPKEPTFSMPSVAPDFMDGPMDRNRSPLARTIKDAPRAIKDTPKPSPLREEHKEPSFGPQPTADEEEFSMSIVLDGDSVPSNTPADPDFDKPTTAPVPEKLEPYRSEIARQLGIPAYTSEAEESTVDQTVMLEEPVEIVPTTMGNGPESLFEEHERQLGKKEGKGKSKGIEDRRQKRSGGYIWMLGVLGMLVVFALLASYLMRTELARSVPSLRPTLESACASIGCTVPYPQDADQIVLQGHSFNPDPGQDGKYRLVVTLNNKAAYGQAWPNIELTVTDRFDIAVARRVLKPADWLPATYAKQPAFESHSEVTANLAIALDNVQAAGYRLYVFYP